MPKEPKHEVWTPTEASKATINACAEVVDACRDSVAKVLFDVAMAPLLGIQIGGIGREPMHLDLRGRPYIRFDHRRAVGIEPVPDNDEGAGNVALEVTEGDHHVVSAAGMREMSLVDATRQG